MSAHASTLPNLPKKLISSQVFGMLVFVFTEVMFFTALISAFLVIKAGNPSWQLPHGITLPVYATLFNTLLLLASGGTLVWGYTNLQKGVPLEKVRTLILQSTLLGGLFVGFQGYEWIQLISFGMTMHSSIFGACFFLLIGTHGLHALLGVIYLGYTFFSSKQSLDSANLAALSVFWLFIVGIWPILYGLVYF